MRGRRPTTPAVPFQTTTRSRAAQTERSAPAGRTRAEQTPPAGNARGQAEQIIVRHRERQIREVEMAANEDLVAALQALTAQITEERTAAQAQNNALVEALNQQRQQNEALVGLLQGQQVGLEQAPQVQVQQQVQAPRISTTAVESIPKFEGGVGEFAQDFVDYIERVAVAEGWNDGQRIQVAARRVTKTALEWHIHSGHVHATWAAWSADFVTNFSPRLAYGDWLQQVQARRQRPGESGIEYALAKRKILRASPVPLPPEQEVAFLINGLVRWQHESALMGVRPNNFAEFLTRIRTLESLDTSGPVAAAGAVVGLPPNAPSVPPPPLPDLSKILASFGEKLIGEVTAKFGKLSLGSSEAAATEIKATGTISETGVRGGSRSVGRGGYRGNGRGGSGSAVGGAPSTPGAPDTRECYYCHAVGHIARYCPRLALKEGAGH